MTRMGMWLAALALTGAGCMGLPQLGEEIKPAPASVEVTPPLPPVLPGTVDANNALQIERQLRAELERASAEGTVSIATQPSENAKP